MSFIFGTRILRLETGSILRVMSTGSLIALPKWNHDHDVACQKIREKRIESLMGLRHAVPLFTGCFSGMLPTMYFRPSTIDTKCTAGHQLTLHVSGTTDLRN